ncbi:MAG: lipoate--protein ligase family protein, partial [Candidatus Dormibacteraeota bacterium]|nr:lipoate--protein ligase family protein [Candidatus Dormibacteraeota bacterium]
HATMSYDMNSDRMLEVLRIGREKLSDKGIPSAARRVGPLRLQTQLPRDEVIERMIRSFADQVGGVEEVPISPDELAAAEELVRTRYGTDAWVHELP